jgi:putative sigma-54 modulation protein
MMRIAIQVRNADPTEELREHVEHRLAFALSQFPEHIRGVVVVLSDINGPKDGIDKRCSLRVRLNGRSDIVIEETEADFHVAVNRAADRAKRTLGRRLRRVRDTFSERAS